MFYGVLLFRKILNNFKVLKMDNISQQCDEIEALKSIFEDQWEIDAGTYSMRIDKNIKLFITLNPDYPSDAPPKYELLAPNLSSAQKNLIKNEFQRIYEEECGSPIIFQWIEQLKDIVAKNSPTETSLSEDFSCESLTLNDVIETNQYTGDSADEEILNITHGPTIVDRKSVFQGHACEVKDEKDIKKVMNYLLTNKKIAQATHNILAYRILLPNSVIMQVGSLLGIITLWPNQDCDDDGETHAAGRILHLLQILKLTNVMVVVSRWYGGTHLGPDRFKHINNAARQVLLEGGFIKS